MNHDEVDVLMRQKGFNKNPKKFNQQPWGTVIEYARPCYDGSNDDRVNAVLCEFDEDGNLINVFAPVVSDILGLMTVLKTL